jgi:hypothetical protein
MSAMIDSPAQSQLIEFLYPRIAVTGEVEKTSPCRCSSISRPIAARLSAPHALMRALPHGLTAGCSRIA